MSIVIERMTEDDVSAVEKLEKECFSTPWSVETLKANVNNPIYTMIVAKDEGRVLGYIGAYVAGDELNITNLAVNWASRRRGIGMELLKNIVQSGRGRITTAFLEVRVSNAPAIALYRKAGFVKVGVRKNYYQDPTEDAVMMRLEFEF